MNLIGHMVCAEHLGPDGRLGAMVPDLLSLYDRKLRPMKLLRGVASPIAGGASQSTESAGSSTALNDGVRFHFFVDSAFHRADLFRECADGIRDGLLAVSQAPGLKRYAAAHVLTELFLDHLLVVERRSRLADFYGALRLGRAEASREYLDTLPGMDWPGFSDFLARLEAMRFADGYVDRPHLLDRMDRILLRLRQRPLERIERIAVLELFDRQAGPVAGKLAAFIADMQRWDATASVSPGGSEGGPRGGVDSRGQPGLE